MDAPITRRSAIITTAGLAAAASAPAAIDAVVQRNDEYVRRLLRRQAADGGVSDEFGLFPAGTVGGLLESGTASFLHPASKLHKSQELFSKLALGAKFLESVQRPSGNIDLITTNFDSTPDTGFTVHAVGTAACLASRANNAELVGLTREFLRKAAAGMAEGGVHTPNHRWVVSSALAQVYELDPNPAYLRRINQWLAEGIDIDSEGQFSERSTGIYNTVCDRAFVVLATKLNRPELLDPVRRNLASMLYLSHPNFEVVTEVSRRQDRAQRADMGRYWFPLRFLANHDNEGVYASIADAMEPNFSTLSAFMEYPELTQPGPARKPPPDNYRKDFPGLGLVRLRHGLTSATIVQGGSTFFTLRYGDAVVQAVRMASPFFGHGQFQSPKITNAEKGWLLEQTLENGYYQPLDPPREVGTNDWRSLRPDRKMSNVCRLKQSARILEVENGFRVEFEAQGTDRIPVGIEISLRSGGKLEGAGAGGVLGNEDFATYRVGNRSIRFGPGAAHHRYTRMRGADPELPGQSVYITGFTPFQHAVTFTCS